MRFFQNAKIKSMIILKASLHYLLNFNKYEFLIFLIRTNAFSVVYGKSVTNN